MMMGMFVMGSIISPLIVISTCMEPPIVPRSKYRERGTLCQRMVCQPPHERVGARAGDLDGDLAAEQVGAAVEMDDAEVGGPPGHPTPVGIHGVHEDHLAAADGSPVPLALTALLELVQDLEAAVLLLGRDVVS